MQMSGPLCYIYYVLRLSKGMQPDRCVQFGSNCSRKMGTVYVHGTYQSWSYIFPSLDKSGGVRTIKFS